MTTGEPNGLRLAATAIGLVALVGAVHGCSSPTAPPAPPAGGAAMNLSFEEYTLRVAPVISRQGCDADGDCHGGGIRGSLQLSPATAKNLRFDFDQISLEVSPSVPDSSPVLTKPLALAAGGTPHAFKPFASTSDTDYVAIRQWILDGAQP